MSLILDALRKIELERKARRQEGMNIRSEVLTYRGNPRQPAKSRLLPVIVVALLLIIAAVSFSLYRSTRPAATVGEAMNSADKAGQTVTAPAPDVLVTSPGPSPAPMKEEPAAPPATVPNAVPAPAVPRVNAQPRQNSTANEGGSITISGIAWQEERNLRRAVINGSLVGEGAEISGARIVEIREDRVRFLRDGQVFEVPYSSATHR